jgi:IMP dehydrogenase/GMP reductase
VERVRLARAAPFEDLNFPGEGTSKEFYLTQFIGADGQLQWFNSAGRTRWHVGIGPSIYRVVLQNHRKVLKDPISLELHSGTHMGGSAEFGYEKFMKKLPNTSIELTAAGTSRSPSRTCAGRRAGTTTRRRSRPASARTTTTTSASRSRRVPSRGSRPDGARPRCLHAVAFRDVRCGHARPPRAAAPREDARVSDRVAWSEKVGPEALTFDDVLLVPGYAAIHPRDVDTRSRFSRRIAVNIPVVSAAMDTVTESALAIALARLGGIGVIHKNLSIEEQVAQVDRVKRSESGMITDPVTLPPTATLADARAIMTRFHISGVPITEQGKLVGILTNRDLRFEDDDSVGVSEVMTRARLVTAPVGTTLEAARTILAKHRIEKLPVVDERMMLKGLITVKDIEKRIRPPAGVQGPARPAARRSRRGRGR